ncbi:hypothetical protein [Nocardia sp. NPDC051570]|uniref:hypothetical protein n=1 Tax=Nocardia sp. NPDC051570 TaxID=3364324 RepID=UPI0037AD289B
MGDILQADLDILHRLGGTLASHADAIGQIKVSATAAMPNSPLQDASARATDAVLKAYGLIGRNIRQLSDATNSAAKTYEEVDQLFADQLHRYTNGEQPR